MKKVIGFLGNPWGQRLTILVIIAVVMAVFQQNFFRPSNFSSILLAISLYGIMACGMLFVVLLGGIDLSVGSMAAMTASILAMSAQSSGYTAAGFITGVLLGLAACVAVGIVHGVLVTYFAIPAFVVTLATKYIVYGLVLLVTGGHFVQIIDKGILYQLGNARLFGAIPMPEVIFILYAVLCAVILGKTVFGRRLYATGGNPVASKLVGVKTNGTVLVSYVICSISAGIGGMILASMNMQAGPTTAGGYEGNVLTAMVVGGLNLAGGEGGVVGAIFGALLVGIINNMLILLGVPSDYTTFVQGVIIIAAVSLNMYTSRRSQGLTRRRTKKPPEKIPVTR
ncbi:ribose transport system permease protein [Sporobacter termitidis DSM 10068]|uniref:Ribose transport system permease protein n=1 Tax=Sporobacter termitidis DSM 10068 TaxID=1123282 RepID=A0A1M5YDX5_9FIRM|nr:ABC transporter permease [Sporobacter termitidis]SHI10152.1 ribose transport system permease protein [Sporobacter termitidis DSM 10068]